jgi:hypothetical protein
MTPSTSSSPDKLSEASGSPVESDVGQPGPSASQVRRFGALVAGDSVDGAKEMQAAGTDADPIGEVGEVDEPPQLDHPATQGVIAEMRRHFRRNSQKGAPRTT